MASGDACPPPMRPRIHRWRRVAISSPPVEDDIVFGAAGGDASSADRLISRRHCRENWLTTPDREILQLWRQDLTMSPWVAMKTQKTAVYEDPPTTEPTRRSPNDDQTAGKLLPIDN